jgi:hypothetical protein
MSPRQSALGEFLDLESSGSHNVISRAVAQPLPQIYARLRERTSGLGRWHGSSENEPSGSLQVSREESQIANYYWVWQPFCHTRRKDAQQSTPEMKGSHNASTGFFKDVHDSLSKATGSCPLDAVVASLQPVKGWSTADSIYISKRANYGISTMTFPCHSFAAAEEGSDSPGQLTSLRSPTGPEPSRREGYGL